MLKTLKIYDALPEVERKQWLTLAQISDSYYRHLCIPSRLNKVDKVSSIRKRHMAIQSSEYAYHIKNEKGKYYGVEYDVEKFYNRKDVDAWVEDNDFDFSFDKIRPVMTAKRELKDFRTYINDKRNLDFIPEEGVVKFYGDKVNCLKYESKSNQFRMYYGLFMNQKMIKNVVCKMHNMNDNTLDILVFMFVYKFFTILELFHFHSIINHFNISGDKVRGVNDVTSSLMKHGYIKPVKYNKAYIGQWHSRAIKKALFKTTEKTDKLVRDYMDYCMYKRKLPYMGSTRNGQRLKSYDVKFNFMMDKMVYGINSPRAYMFYEYCYDYVNYKAEVELFDEDMTEYFKKSKSSELYFNPLLYKIAQEEYIRSNGKDDSKKYLSKFLSNRRWGHKI